jgi:mannose-6-phosphate isomerase-like protein (cupin superfamily)
MKHFHYNSETSININDDGSISIVDKQESLDFDELDKPRFVNQETGESVVEYSGLATDHNESRSWAKAYFTAEGFSEKHYHNEREEIYYIISGKAKIVIDDEEQILNPGDSVTIHPRQNHQVYSIDAIPLELIVKCSPSWTPSDHNIVHEQTFGMRK